MLTVEFKINDRLIKKFYIKNIYQYAVSETDYEVVYTDYDDIGEGLSNVTSDTFIIRKFNSSLGCLKLFEKIVGWINRKGIK